MPTYEYVCTNCQNQWEEIQKISEPALTECPKCKQATAQRQISGGNFILKGGGWYADLYSSAKPSSGSGGSGGTKAEKSDTSSAKTESTSSAPASTAPAAPSASPPASPAKKD